MSRKGIGAKYVQREMAKGRSLASIEAAAKARGLRIRPEAAAIFASRLKKGSGVKAKKPGSRTGIGAGYVQKELDRGRTIAQINREATKRGFKVRQSAQDMFKAGRKTAKDLRDKGYKVGKGKSVEVDAGYVKKELDAGKSLEKIEKRANKRGYSIDRDARNMFNSGRTKEADAAGRYFDPTNYSGAKYDYMGKGGFGAGAMRRAQAAGFTDDQIRQTVSNAGVNVRRGAAERLGVEQGMTPFQTAAQVLAAAAKAPTATPAPEPAPPPIPTAPPSPAAAIPPAAPAGGAGTAPATGTTEPGDTDSGAGTPDVEEILATSYGTFDNTPETPDSAATTTEPGTETVGSTPTSTPEVEAEPDPEPEYQQYVYNFYGFNPDQPSAVPSTAASSYKPQTQTTSTKSETQSTQTPEEQYTSRFNNLVEEKGGMTTEAPVGSMSEAVKDVEETIEEEKEENETFDARGSLTTGGTNYSVQPIRAVERSRNYLASGGSSGYYARRFG